MPSAPARSVPSRVIETLLVGGAGGTLFTLAGFPAGLISGSVTAVAIAALAGRPMFVNTGVMRFVMVIVGIALGAVVTPETLRGFATYPLSIALLCLSTFGIIAAAGSYLRFVHGWDPVAAMFGASPGALAQTVALLAECGVDPRGVVVVQTMRILFLTLGIPLGLSLAGQGSTSGIALPAGTADPLPMAVLVVVSALTAIGLYKVKFPGGWIFGAMLGSAILHGGGFIEGTLPSWVTAAAMTSLGAVTGSRFAGTPLRLLLSYLGAAIGSFAVAMGVASIFVVIVSHFLDVPAGDIVIAYSPGAQDTMMVLALALHLDPVYVGAHHVARYLIVSLGNPFLARLLSRTPLHEVEAEKPSQATGD